MVARPGRVRTVLTAVVAMVAATAVLLLWTGRPARAAGRLTCHYDLAQWSGGFSATLSIANNSTATINGWTASWTFRHPTAVGNTWQGTITQGTPYDATARNAVYNGRIPPGSVVALGWIATATATEVPSEIVVNGAGCPVS